MIVNVLTWPWGNKISSINTVSSMRRWLCVVIIVLMKHAFPNLLSSTVNYSNRNKNEFHEWWKNQKFLVKLGWVQNESPSMQQRNNLKILIQRYKNNKSIFALKNIKNLKI